MKTYYASLILVCIMLISSNVVNAQCDPDVTPPNCLYQPFTVYLDDEGQATVDAEDINDNSFDDCSDVSTSINIGSFDCNDLGDNLVLLTVTDEAGNSSSCETFVSVLDTTPPVTVLSDFVLLLDNQGQGTVTPSDIDAGCSDNCSSYTINILQDNFTCADLGDNNIEVVVQDDNGNMTTDTVIITVIMTDVPEIICPNDTTVLCNTSVLPYSKFGDFELVNTCGGEIDFLETIVDSLNECGIGYIERVFILNENGVVSGADTCVQRITVINQNPLTEDRISFPENINLDACSADLDVTGDVSINTIGLTCLDLFVEFEDDTLQQSCPLVIQRNWVVSDSCANPVSTYEYAQQITVQDIYPPELICPESITVLPSPGNCEASVQLIAEAVDNCELISITNDSPFASSNEDDASGIYPLGLTQITFTATDHCGNSSSCIVEVLVENVVELNCNLSDLTIQLPVSNAPDSIVLDTSDLDFTIESCIGIASVELSNNKFFCDQSVEEISLIVTDFEGNISTCSANVYIESSCVNFNNETPTSIETNTTENEELLLSDWSSSCASIGFSMGGTALSIDSVHLEVKNENCASDSYIFTNTLFNGNLGVYNQPVALCYSIEILAGENNSATPVSTLTLFNGTSPANSTLFAIFQPSTVQTSADGYQTISAPLEMITGSTLPTNSYGTWLMSDPTQWNELIQNVGGIAFYLEEATGVESYGFDNICIKPEFDILPAITCPTNIEVSCYDLDNIEFGTVGFPESCNMEYLVDTIVTNNLNDCNTGELIRELVVIDELGRSVSCLQIVDVDGPDENFLDAPSSTTIILDQGQCEELVEIPSATINDFACSPNINFTTLVNGVNINGNGGFVNLAAGKYEIEYIGIDICGNQSQVTSEINLLRPCELPVHTQLHLSVNNLCEGVVTAEMVATFPVVCENYYDLILIDEAGDTLSSLFVDYQHIGQNLTFVLTEPNCGNSAWGNILIEDKLAPEIDCQSDTIACGELIDFYTPIVYEPCNNYTLEMIDETLEDVSCTDPFIQSILTRHYVAIDESGNESPVCEQKLYISKFDISTIAPPTAMYDLECGVDYPKDENGAPDPFYYGGPTVEGNDIFADQGEECNLMTIFKDKFISTPQADIIVREFSTLYWSCDIDTIIEFVQIFKFVDTNGPQITCPSDELIASNADACSADYLVPAFQAEEICGSVSHFDIKLENQYVSHAVGKIVNLPMGENVITVIAFDALGNSTECYYTVTVQDLSAPTPICDSETVVPLPFEGFVEVKAEVFDQASHDYCGIDRFEIRRMDATCSADDLLFGPTVTFCCEDLGTEVMVVLRVFDVNGNYNDCMVTAEVQDKLSPVLIADLPDITVSCEYPITPDYPEAFGKVVSNYDDRDSIIITADYVEFYGDPFDAIVLDNCVSVSSDEIDTTTLNTCGLGEMVRTITIADEQGNDLVLTQTITRINIEHFDEQDITWPKHFYAENYCSAEDLDPASLPDSSAYPILANTSCDKVGWSYEDSFFDLSQGDEACFKIRRTWTILNWCEVDDYGNYATFSFQQILKISNTNDPVIIAECEYFEQCSYSSDCSPVFVELVNEAMDDCTDSINLVWQYGIDLHSDGTIDITGATNDASGIYDLGLHTIYWNVYDQCGGSSSCSHQFELKNCKEPIAYCIDNVAGDLTPMDTDGDGQIDTEMVILKPYMLDAGSQSACGGPVYISFSEDIYDTIRIYDCFDVGTNTVMMWVTDELGNQSFCTTSFEVQDNNPSDFCEEGFAISIGGNISTSLPVEMEDVKVTINENESVLTSEIGEYAFDNLNINEMYKITPSKDDDPLKGLSVGDIVLIKKHILGLAPLQDPYKILAADVNQSESVEGTDILVLRKLLLGHYDDFPASEPWKFYVEEDFVDPMMPWLNTIQESFESELEGETMVDFVGVKMGDVNQSGAVNGLSGEDVNTRSAVQLMAENISFEANEMIEVPFVLGQAQRLDAFQWEVEWNSDLAVLDELSSADDNLPIHYYLDAEKGVLRIISYVDQTQEMDENGVVFTIWARAQKAGMLSDVITHSIHPRIANEWISNNLAQPIELKLEGTTKEVTSVFDIKQNNPNPWKDMTSITILSRTSANANISIVNSVGKEVYTSQFPVTAGENVWVIYPESLGGSGVYYYSVEIEGEKRMKKMILVK